MDQLDKLFIKTDQDLTTLDPGDLVIGDSDEKKPSAEDLLRENIVKANKFLDLALTTVEGDGSLTSLWIERVAKLVDSVTLAAEKMIGAGTEFMDLEIKRDLVTLKSRELELRGSGGGVRSLTQNVFKMTREDALKLLAEGAEE